MNAEDRTHQWLDVVHGSDPDIDVSSLLLTVPTLAGAHSVAIISHSFRSPDTAEPYWGNSPPGFGQAPDTCGPAQLHVPEYTFTPLSSSGLHTSHSVDWSPLNAYLAEDQRIERLGLGLPLVQVSPSFDVSFDCEHCGKTFARASDLRKHTRYHTKPFSCPANDCESSFGTKRDLGRHIEGRHECKRDNFFCPHPGCERAERGLGKENGFVRRDHLQQHMRQRHKTDD